MSEHHEALGRYRVVELSGMRTQFAGFLLAGLGADVISVEPPEGCDSRQRSPFAAAPGSERAPLWHQAYGRGRRSVVVDPAREEDVVSLHTLLSGADIVIDAQGPDGLARYGVDVERLVAEQPDLVLASLSAFGPSADLADSDLAILAASGALRFGGDADRAPCRLSLDQAWLHAGAAAAVAALMALYERNRSGRGQLVQVSAQQACTIGAGGWVLSAPAGSPPMQRAGGGTRAGRLDIRYVWPALDGHVSITHVFGPAFGPATARLMAWVHEAGFCDEAMRDRDWIGYGSLLVSGEESAEALAEVHGAIAAFTASRPKAELFEEAQRRRVLLAPVNDIAELYALDHFAARGYWEPFASPAGDTTWRHPGPWARMQATPLRRLDVAPRLGEHTARVRLDEPRRRASSAPDARPPSLPLSGVKVVDFTRSFAGPTVTRALADFGATVVRVESSRAMDAGRTVMPYLHDEPGIERSVLFSSLNSGKLGIALDLTRSEGRDVAVDLARWADVVIETFSPRQMAKWGLGFEDLRQVNPSLIMLSSSLMGSTGPMSDFAGYGNLAAAICGFTALLGWPDRAPAGPFAAYTDYLSPYFMLAALLGALDHRRREGEGQHIDVSQAEASLHFLTPLLLAFEADGDVAGRRGNEDIDGAPHGVFRCAGDDEWVAICCVDDEQWAALCAVMDRPDLRADSSLATAAGRRARQAELAAEIERWTRAGSAPEIAARLQPARVPAYRVQGSAECAADPRLGALQHFRTVDHPLLGEHVVEGPRWQLLRTPGGPSRGGPMMNEHGRHVLAEILRYEDERIAALVEQDVLV